MGCLNAILAIVVIGIFLCLGGVVLCIVGVVLVLPITFFAHVIDTLIARYRLEIEFKKQVKAREEMLAKMTKEEKEAFLKREKEEYWEEKKRREELEWRYRADKNW